MYNMPMKRINFYLPAQQLNALRGLSKETGLSVSEYIRRAIDQYFMGEGSESKGRNGKRVREIDGYKKGGQKQ